MKLKWWDWLLASPYSLRERGLDPTHRLAKTGHSRALSYRWAKTIGMWALRSETDIKKASGTSAQSTAIFRQRYGLYSAAQSLRVNYPEHTAENYGVFGQVMTACHAHYAVHSALGANCFSLGAAARSCTGRVNSDNRIPQSLRPRVEGTLGILPIEALLYHSVIEWVLKKTQIPRQNWFNLMGTDRIEDWTTLREYWIRHECSEKCGLPDEAEKYSVL